MKNKIVLFILLLMTLIGCEKTYNNEYLEQGTNLIKIGNYEEAKIVFEKAIEIDPKNINNYKQVLDLVVDSDDMTLSILSWASSELDEHEYNELLEEYADKEVSLSNSVLQDSLEHYILNGTRKLKLSDLLSIEAIRISGSDWYLYVNSLSNDAEKNGYQFNDSDYYYGDYYFFDAGINIDDLSLFKNLKCLDIEDYQGDLSILNSLNNLEYLSLNVTTCFKIESIDFLYSMPHLKYLEMHRLADSIDYSPLESLTELEEVWMHHCRIGSFRYFENCLNLESFNFYNSPMKDWEILYNFKKLKYIYYKVGPSCGRELNSDLFWWADYIEEKSSDGSFYFRPKKEYLPNLEILTSILEADESYIDDDEGWGWFISEE